MPADLRSRSADARVTLALHAPARALAPGVRESLARLGYAIVRGRERGARDGSGAGARPALRIVHERRLETLPVEAEPEVPLILLVGARGPLRSDARAVGVVRRRATLAALYPLLQRALEATPRSAPRVPAAFPAHCRRGGARLPGAVRSLSARGCLFRGPALPELERRVELRFALPGHGLVRVEALALAARGAGAGLSFRDCPEPDRAAIEAYVARRLSSRGPPLPPRSARG